MGRYGICEATAGYSLYGRFVVQDLGSDGILHEALVGM